MDVADLSVELRPRRGWEAVDLGFRMAREWWRPIGGVWLAVFAPTALVVHLVLHAHPLLAAFVLWWLKPVFDRFVLHVVSRAVFGEIPTVRETLAAWPRILRPGLLAALTTHRLQPARSAMLAVWQLEGQRGRTAARRRASLGRRLDGGFGATVLCLHFEAVIFLSLAAMGALLSPAGVPSDFQIIELVLGREGSEKPLWSLRDGLCYALAVSIIEPFYVAAGFALYLNRRAVLEGWDLELALRRLDARLRSPASAASSAAPTLALVLCAGVALLAAPVVAPMAAPTEPAGPMAPAAPVTVGTPAGAAMTGKPTTATRAAEATKPVMATTVAAAPGTLPGQLPPLEESAPPALGSPARSAIREVLSAPDFDEYRERRRWVYRGKPTGDRPLPPESGSWERLGRFLATLSQLLLWIVAALTILWLLRLLWRAVPADTGLARPTPRPPPDALFGLALAPESLPEDIAAAANTLLREGRAREALSLLYRGALSDLVHRHHLPLAEGHTEGDCRKAAASALPRAGAEYFARLVATWTEAAYAGRLPDSERAGALCLEWPRHFGVRTPTAARG